MPNTKNELITTEEIAAAIDSRMYPPILNVDQAASLLGVSRHSIYRWSSEGRFKHATRRGKPLRFFRDRLIRAFFEEG